MQHLTDQTMLGGITMKNRFVRSAVGDHTYLGHLSEESYRLYQGLAECGAALLITGFSVVDPKEQIANIFSMADDSLISEYQKLTQMVHEAGSTIVVQLAYLCGFAPIERPLSPSDGRNVYTQTETYAMTLDEIEEMRQNFACAARRAKEMGFDGVEIHAAHGFLHHQFFSPLMNHRTDLYGGSVENRSRFLMETIKAIQNETGHEFPIMVKISVDDVPQEDFMYLARQLDESGVVAIETSGSWATHKPKERTYYHDAAATIAANVKCSVIQTGGNREFEMLEQQLNSTEVDYFAFARPFISEPDFVNKYLQGEIQKPRCLSCNFCASNPQYICVFEKDKLKKA